MKIQKRGGIMARANPLYSPVAVLVDYGEVHKFLGDAILWLAGGHVLTTIYPHAWLKDKVMDSMLP